MMEILVSVALLALVGCASNDITVFQMVEGELQPVLQVEQSFSGKGCIAVDSDPTTGKASVIVQQAGTSDWSISRLFGFLGDTVGAVFGGSRGMDEMQGPTAGMQGCEGIFNGHGDGDEYDPPPPEVLYRATPEDAP
jgi:hypothetical protein